MYEVVGACEGGVDVCMCVGGGVGWDYLLPVLTS